MVASLFFLGRRFTGLPNRLQPVLGRIHPVKQVLPLPESL